MVKFINDFLTIKHGVYQLPPVSRITKHKISHWVAVPIFIVLVLAVIGLIWQLTLGAIQIIDHL